MSNNAEKKLDVLSYLISVQSEKGYIPSVREICDAVQTGSTATVQRYLTSLEEDGYILREKGKSRSVQILKDRDGNDLTTLYSREDASAPLPSSLPELVPVPVLGKVAAGQPILAEENIEDYFPIPVNYTHNSDVFMLRVRGESMINAGIFNNDLVLVQQQNTARNGDYVVALIGDGATVKTFYKEPNYIRLQPENDSMDPILVMDCKILGKVIGLYRNI